MRFFSKSLLTFDLLGLFWWRTFKNTLLAVFLKDVGFEANLYDPGVIIVVNNVGTNNRPLFLSQFFQFLAFWESSCFDFRIDSSWRVLLQPCQNPVYLCAQIREFLSMYLLPNWWKYARVLSYLVRNSSNKQHQSERVFTMAQIYADAVMTETVN